MGKLFKKLSGSKVSKLDLFVYLLNKGGLPFLRFLKFRCSSFGSHRFPSFVGRGCDISHTRHLKTGRNFFLGAFSYINCLCEHGVSIGDNVTIREYAWLQVTSVLSNPGAGIIIADNTYIGPRCILGAAASLKIGARCQVGANVSFVAENHKFEAGSEIFSQGVEREGIEIGNDCWIGNNAVVLDGVRLGDGCVVGAGAVVTKSFPANSIVAGVPARVVRER